MAFLRFKTDKHSGRTYLYEETRTYIPGQRNPKLQSKSLGRVNYGFWWLLGVFLINLSDKGDGIDWDKLEREELERQEKEEREHRARTFDQNKFLAQTTHPVNEARPAAHPALDVERPAAPAADEAPATADSEQDAAAPGNVEG